MLVRVRFLEGTVFLSLRFHLCLLFCHKHKNMTWCGHTHTHTLLTNQPHFHKPQSSTGGGGSVFERVPPDIHGSNRRDVNPKEKEILSLSLLCYNDRQTQWDRLVSRLTSHVSLMNKQYQLLLQQTVLAVRAAAAHSQKHHKEGTGLCRFLFVSMQKGFIRLSCFSFFFIPSRPSKSTWCR